jgi:hypothetical protein
MKSLAFNDLVPNGLGREAHKQFLPSLARLIR